MSDDNITNKVIYIIKDLTKIDINVNAIIQDISLDSITFIKMVVALEETFNFEFDDEMLLIIKFPTIKSVIEYVESKVT